MSIERTQSGCNLRWHDGCIGRAERFAALKTTGATVWLTGLPASGKSTIAAALEQSVIQRGRFCYRLDGDNIRLGLNKDLGFSHEDRAENIRRIGEVCRLFADSGVIAIASFISPYRADRELVRALHAQSAGGALPFLEVFVDTPVSVCEERDPKGLYAKARAGHLKGFTGVDDPYEPPAKPDLVLKPAAESVEACVQACVDLLAGRGVICRG